MNFKIWGVMFILLSGVYTTFEVKKRYDKRIESLTLFLGDFNFFINQISFLKTPVAEIVLLLLKSKENEFQSFYKMIFDYYSFGNQEKLKGAFLINELYLTKKDKELIYDCFRNLGNTDYENQLNNLKAQRETLKTILKEAKENKVKNQKSKCTLTMCLFFLVIIFLM